MSVKSAPFYWLVCDRCGGRSTETGDYYAWADVSQAREHADDEGWLILPEGDYCQECYVWDDDLDEQVPLPVLVALDGDQ